MNSSPLKMVLLRLHLLIISYWTWYNLVKNVSWKFNFKTTIEDALGYLTGVEGIEMHQMVFPVVK